MIEDIKIDLPNIPEEVISLWLLPFAEIDGYPPTNHNCWDIKKSGENLAFWNDAIWKKVDIDLSKLDYDRAYFDKMKGLYSSYILNDKSNDYYKLLGEDGKRRFNSCLLYMLKNGTFPQPPILMINEVNKYDVLDGNHRFLAYVTAQNTYVEFEQLSKKAKDDYLSKMNLNTIHNPSNIQSVWVVSPNWEKSKSAQNREYLRRNGFLFI